MNPFQNNSKNVLFIKSALACPKIVGSDPPAPRSKVLECALLLRCWPSRSRADRPSYRSAEVSTYWRDTLYIAKLLLDHSDNNIDLNAKNGYGQTAFMFACRKGHKDVVRLLLDHSDKYIDLNANDKDGMNAFEVARNNGHTDLIYITDKKVLIP